MLTCTRDYMDPTRHYTVLDVGSRVVDNQKVSHRTLFEPFDHTYVGIDVTAGLNVDRVMEMPYTFPVEDSFADIIISGQVFEHIPYFWITFVEMARVLKPGGYIFLSAPSRGHVHSPPFDCWRFYQDGYKTLGVFTGLKICRHFTDFPPIRKEDKRFDYGLVPPTRYWGDTVGVFQKTDDYDDAAIAGMRTALQAWGNRQADINGIAKALGSAPAGSQRAPTNVLTHKRFGIRFKYNPEIMLPRVIDSIEAGRYEAREATAISKYVEPGWNVLELGGGLGFVSTYVKQRLNPGKCHVVEADPRLIPVIAETHKLNGVTGVQVHNCIASSDAALVKAGTVDFRLGAHFWASSVKNVDRAAKEDVVKVPVKSFQSLINECKPQALVIDIEGGEIDLFSQIKMPTVNSIIMEIHPKVTGVEAIRKMYGDLEKLGFKSENYEVETDVAVFVRQQSVKRNIVSKAKAVLGRLKK